jgi:hypothetical protein
MHRWRISLLEPSARRQKAGEAKLIQGGVAERRLVDEAEGGGMKGMRACHNNKCNRSFREMQ